MLLALLFIVADACPRVRSTHCLLPTTSNGFGNQYYAIEKAAWLNMILKSDGDDLKKMVKLFDEGKLKVCVDEHFAFDEVKEALSKSLTARSGGKLVIDVASPAPSETCCVVA